MGKRISPMFSTENETHQFKDEISDTDYEKAISVCRTPRDKHGHSEVIGFRVNPIYPRIASELQTKESAFGTLSDFHRTAYRLGCGKILNVLKSKKKIGDEIDDILIACDDLEKMTKTDEAYHRLNEVLNEIPRSLKIYMGDKGRLEKEIEKYRERIKSLKDAFWKNLLMKKFKQKLNSIEEDSLEDEEL